MKKKIYIYMFSPQIPEDYRMSSCHAPQVVLGVLYSTKEMKQVVANWKG